MNSSAIVDLEAAVGSDNSDYEMDYESGIADKKSSGEKLSRASSSRPLKRNTTDDYDDDDERNEDGRSLKGQISKGVASYVWEESRQRANKAFSLYANIDILRPYYDVEPHEVRHRLIMSLVPKIHSGNGPEPSVPRELYGPTMLVFTLIAMLLFEMKSAGHVVREGTLMGTAFVTCFGYWLGVSCVIRLTTYICNTRIATIQILHLLGYALFGHCVVILLTTVFHPYHSHTFFYFIWLIFGGLSTLRLPGPWFNATSNNDVSVLASRTSGQSRKLALAGIVVTLHLLFLLYLHFAYHRVVEELSGVHRADALHPQAEQLVVNDQHAGKSSTS